MKDDIFWDNITKSFTEADTSFEDQSSNSPAESDGYRTLYPDNNEDKGVVVPPQSILRMMVDKEEMPFCAVWFVSKTQQHQKFDAWAKLILAQPGMPKKFQNLGIMRAITQARKESVERNSEDLEFLVSRWSTKMHTFVVTWGEFVPTLEDVVALTSLPMFGDAQVAHFKLKDKDSKARHDPLTQFL